MKKLLFLPLLGMLTLTGCGSIFAKTIDPYELIPVKVNELQTNTYYVKDGTNFYQAHSPNGTAAGVPATPSPLRLLWLTEDESLVPTLYKGEIIAFASVDREFTYLSLERFKDIGYSVGIAGAEYAGGAIRFEKESLTDNSSAFHVLSEKQGSYAIATINDTLVTKDMLNSAGVFTCMEKDKDYHVEFYHGSFHETAAMRATTHMLQSFELYSLENVSFTKNGYAQIELPEDLKSGYYRIDGVGLFKYVAHKKDATLDPAGEALNEPYFATDAERRAYAQKYSVTFDSATLDCKILTEIDPKSVGEGGVSITAVSPDGTEYDFIRQDEGSGYFDLNLTTALPGKWYIYVAPKSVVVKDVSIDSSKLKERPTEEVKVITVDESLMNRTFVSTYTGEGEIHGYVTAPNGQSHDLIVDADNHVATKTFPYVEAGDYTVTIYHYSSVSVTDIFLRDGEYDVTEDITTVEG